MVSLSLRYSLAAQAAGQNFERGFSAMKFRIVLLLISSIMVMTPVMSSASEPAVCKDPDSLCKKLRKLTEAGKYDKVVAKADPAGQLSEESRSYIGNAYLALAGREENTPEQEELYCRKALEYGRIQAYMGLYFIYAQKDEETALGFLREYAMTGPGDPVPFVILGESEMQKMNYRAADIFLREAKRVARARS